jgi:hypothetical protein
MKIAVLSCNQFAVSGVGRGMMTGDCHICSWSRWIGTLYLSAVITCSSVFIARTKFEFRKIYNQIVAEKKLRFHGECLSLHEKIVLYPLQVPLLLQ